MLRRCPRQIIIDQANDNKVCAVVLDTAGDNNDDDNSLSMKINSKSDFKEDGALRKRIQCKHVVVSADALVTQRRNKSCQSDCSVRTTRIIRRIGIVKGQILWNSDDNGHNQQQQQQQILPQQRSLIIIPPNTPLIQNINVVFGVVMDHGASVCPVGYTVVHLSTVISANDHDEDSKVLDRAMEALVSVSSRRYRHFRNQARDAKLYGIEQGEAMELYYVTFSYAVGRGSRSLNLKRNAAAEDDTSSSISGCHIIDRPTLNVTLDDAFQRAKDIFNDIVKAQHRGMRNGKEEPAPAFLKISPKLKEIVDSCRRDSGQNAVDDDDEAEFLESAVNLMKETSPQVDGI